MLSSTLLVNVQIYYLFSSYQRVTFAWCSVLEKDVIRLICVWWVDYSALCWVVLVIYSDWTSDGAYYSIEVLISSYLHLPNSSESHCLVMWLLLCIVLHTRPTCLVRAIRHPMNSDYDSPTDDIFPCLWVSSRIHVCHPQSHIRSEYWSTRLTSQCLDDHKTHHQQDNRIV